MKRLDELGFSHVSEAIGTESGRWGKRSRRKKLKMAVTVQLSLYAAFLLILLLNILLTFPSVVRWLANFAVGFTGMLPGADREDDDF